MYDFTWRSYLWTYGVMLVGALVFFAAIGDPMPAEALPVMLLGTFALSAFLYIAIAPILAFTVSKYRETGSALQTGKRLLGLCVAMLLAAGALALLHLGSEATKAWLAGKSWGWIITGIVGVLTLFGYALNFYDAYRTRKQINSLNTYTPSNRTDVRIK